MNIEIDLSTIHEAQAENPKAQTQIFNTYFELLINLGVRRFNLGEDAQDVAIKTLTKVLKAMSRMQFTSPKGFNMWLFRVHRNCTYDNGRHLLARIRTVPIETLPPSLEPKEEDRDWFEAEVRLKKVMRVLSQHRHGKLLLAYASGTSQNDISRKLGIPQGTIRSRVRRTRRWLQRQVNP